MAAYGKRSEAENFRFEVNRAINRAERGKCGHMPSKDKQFGFEVNGDICRALRG